MNILNLILKKLRVPKTNETKTIDAVQLWTVRWRSRFGPYLDDTCQEVVGFTSEQYAKDFKVALENAFRLIRHTSGTSVSIIKEA